MADLLPVNFPQPQPPAIISYDSADAAIRTGVITYYGAHSFEGASGGSSNYFLTRDSGVYSQYVETEGSADFVDTTYQKRVDVDFDFEQFKTSQVLQGTAVVMIPAGIRTRATGVRTKLYARALIRKWDGTTETEIANATSLELYSPVTTSAWTLDMLTMQITVPKTKFSKGDYLRLTVEFYVKADSTNGIINCVLGHDPANRDGTYLTPSTDATITNQLIFKCPFDVNL